MKIDIAHRATHLLQYRLRQAVKRGRRYRNVALAAVDPRAVPAYWYTDVRNFGDLITPLLLKAHGIRAYCSAPDTARLVVIGSVLQIFPRDYRGVVLGTGMIRDVEYPLPDANILGVRGHLTAERIGAGPRTIFGDPGLLLPDLLAERRQKCFRAGIVPNYADIANPTLSAIARKYRGEAKVINVHRSPLAVMREMDQCECILSSSLHGLIVADALGLPAAWVQLKLLAGHGFKFRDYHSVMGLQRNPIDLRPDQPLADLIARTQRPPQHMLSQVKANLRSMFADYSRSLAPT